MQHTVVGSTNGAIVLVLGMVNTIYETFRITRLLIATAVIVLPAPDPATIRYLEDMLPHLFPQGHFLLYFQLWQNKTNKDSFHLITQGFKTT